MNNFKNAKKITANIDGWLTEKESELLYNLAKKCQGKGSIVEIGSWKGKSTIFLGQGSKDGKQSKIYAIDPHTGSPEHKNAYGRVWTFEKFKDNIKNARVDDLIIPIVKTSEDAVRDFNEPIELIFIDGAHEFESVKLDFEIWFPKVIKAGIMAFHDAIGYPKTGPGKVIEQYVFKSNNFRNMKIVDSIILVEKAEHISVKDKLNKRYIMLLKKILELCLSVRLPRPIRTAGKKIMDIFLY